MAAVWMLMRTLGKWRYFLTGSALALLFALVVRGLGRIFLPLTEWQSFRGTVEDIAEQNAQTLLTVTFTDSRLLQHKVCFPAETGAKAGDEIRFAMQRSLFLSGDYPQNPAHAAESAGRILLRDAQRRQLLRQILQRAAGYILLWIAAAVLCAVTIRFCFPKQ